MAETIAAKSPLAVMGVKNMLNYTRDHTVEDSLRFGSVERERRVLRKSDPLYATYCAGLATKFPI